MNGEILVYVTAGVIIVTITLVGLLFVKKKENNKYKSIADNLEIQKNSITSTPVPLELSKIEPLIKNELMEDKYNKWQERFIYIKENKISKIDDILIDLDLYIDKKDYKNCTTTIARAEMEIYKAKTSADNLLNEIKDITSSEEKYRSIVIKLKTKYRDATNKYEKNKDIYSDMQTAIELQLENIEKNFLDFEKVMEQNDYNEVVKIVKALDTMIDHISIVIDETPDLLLMANELIPRRIKEVKDIYEEMKKDGYPLEYLNIDYNIEESKKNINVIVDKVKMLNLEDCMFELKTILDYMDSLFVDFEKERLSKKVYEETRDGYKEKLDKVKKLFNDIYKELDNIKKTYDLNEDDVKSIHDIKKQLDELVSDSKKLKHKDKDKSTPYSILVKEIETLSDRLKKLEDDLDVSLKSLGNMYDDEVRAREQLEEIEEFLQESKNKMRSYKLPVITDNYYIELKEANEAIVEVITELDKKPIVINTLNVRVDTARDLVLKLYNTTNEMIKTAILAEKTIVYSNRFLPYYEEVLDGIKTAESYFYHGDYKKSLDTAMKACSTVDEDIYKKMLAIYDK